MVGRTKGFVSRKEYRYALFFFVCLFVLHRKALVAKTLSADLAPVLEDVVRMINFVNARPLKIRIFATLCEQMGADHTKSYCSIEVGWLSRGRVLAGVSCGRN